MSNDQSNESEIADGGRSATMYTEPILAELLHRVQSIRAERGTFLIGIDGPGGAGKSTLAADLSERLGRTAIVHMDDLYLTGVQRRSVPAGIGTNYDRQRLVSQVLRPLREGGTTRYQRYDWEMDALTDWIEIAETDFVIVEGVTAIADDVAGSYDLTVWVETPLETCLQRGVERDGERMRAQWENVWIPGDEQYRQKQRPDARADIVVPGVPE